MGKLGVVIITKKKVVRLTDTPSKESREETPDREEIPSKCYHIQLIQSCDIKPFEERFIWEKFEDKNVHITNDAYIEGTEHFQERTGLLTAPIRTSSEMIGTDRKIPVCVLNVTDKPIRVFREQTAATIQELPVTHSVAQVAMATPTSEKEHLVDYNPMSEISVGEELSQEQKEKLETLIRQNKTVFDYPGNHGYTSTIEHTIQTGETEPIMCQPRRHNLGFTQKINEAVEKHVEAGHLTPSNSPWAFPIVPVLKPDKTVRLCVDYRPLNKITQNDPFPTGNLQDVLDNLAGANYFSVIDLAQGYLQVPLAEKDRAKTAFRSPTGFWEWTRMPYELKGSPFQILPVRDKNYLKTDHKPLLKLLEQKDPFGRRATMIRDINEFEPCIEFIRGQDNFMADALSRLGWNTQPPKEDNPIVVAAMESQKPEGQFFSHELDINLEELRSKQEEDPKLKPYLLTHRNEAGLATLKGKGQVLVPASFIPAILA